MKSLENYYLGDHHNHSDSQKRTLPPLKEVMKLSDIQQDTELERYVSSPSPLLDSKNDSMSDNGSEVNIRGMSKLAELAADFRIHYSDSETSIGGEDGEATEDLGDIMVRKSPKKVAPLSEMEHQSNESSQPQLLFDSSPRPSTPNENTLIIKSQSATSLLKAIPDRSDSPLVSLSFNELKPGSFRTNPLASQQIMASPRSEDDSRYTSPYTPAQSNRTFQRLMSERSITSTEAARNDRVGKEQETIMFLFLLGFICGGAVTWLIGYYMFKESKDPEVRNWALYCKKAALMFGVFSVCAFIGLSGFIVFFAIAVGIASK